jgi:hypothetical protein
MVIIFSSEKARKQLLEKGIVATFRAHRKLKTGRDWATDKREGKKLADVIILEVGRFDPRDLKNYVYNSGFDSLDEWLLEIIKLNKGRIPIFGWLYLVIDIHGKYITETVPQLYESLFNLSQAIAKASEPIYAWLDEVSNDPIWSTLMKPVKRRNPALFKRRIEDLRDEVWNGGDEDLG